MHYSYSLLQSDFLTVFALKKKEEKNSNTKMGGNTNKWGHLAHQSGFYEYGLSPFQTKAFKGFFQPGLSNFIKRTGRQAMFILPPMIAFYSLAKWADGKVYTILQVLIISSLNFIIERNTCLVKKD